MVDKKNSTLTTVDNTGPAYASPAYPQKKYEYMRINDISIAKYNELGSQGWLLISEEGRWSVWQREIM